MCQLSARWTSDQDTGTTLSQYHWQRGALRYSLCLTHGWFATAGSASWNGATGGAARRRFLEEDPASASCLPLLSLKNDIADG